jgi:tetratricopeptide (TPR) repeat protein
MAEDLITDLSKISNLYVAARNSSFSFKGQMPDIQEVAKKLKVSLVLEGSVRKMGDRLRINAQLINAADGDHLWAERYDGDMSEIFDFQDSIRAEIVTALNVQLTAREAARPRQRITDSVEAYEIYLQGRAEFYRFDPEGTLAATQLMRRAIEVDPNFAAAYATLSGTLQHGWTYAFPGFDDAFEQFLEIAQRGVELDNTLGLAHARLGWALIYFRLYDEAIVSFDHAVDLEPNHAETYIWFSEALNYAGDPARGSDCAKKAVEMEFFSTPPVYNLIEGHSHYLLRDYDRAEELLRRAISRAPGFPLPYLLLGIVYYEMGRADDAAAQFAILHKTIPTHVLDIVVSRLPYRDDEPKRRMRDALDNTDKPG